MQIKQKAFRKWRLSSFVLCIFLVCTSSFYSLEFIPLGGGIKVHHTYYVLGYNQKNKQADWVYYELRNRGGKKVTRRDHFRVDPKLKSNISTPDDYRKSGYDRGHLCPAADMAFDIDAMSETFYMSNISPQVAAFNRGIWKRLEERIRKRAQGEILHVVTGPIFKDCKGTIGRNKVVVPGYFYKLFYSPKQQQMIAYVLANQDGVQDLKSCVVPVDKVEELTGIDFFPQLPDDLERILEADTSSHVMLLGEGGIQMKDRGRRWKAVVTAVALFVLFQVFRRKFLSKLGKKRRRKIRKR